MKSAGNGEIETCAKNLLKTLRFEVKNDVLRGMPPELIDRSAAGVKGELNAAGKWLLETYEPRVDAEEVNVDLDVGTV